MKDCNLGSIKSIKAVFFRQKSFAGIAAAAA
jgi:hypothetical protein